MEERLDDLLDLLDEDDKFEDFSTLIDEIKGTKLMGQYFTKLLNYTKDFREGDQCQAFSALIDAIKKTELMGEKFSELFNWLENLPEFHQYRSFSTLICAIKETDAYKDFSTQLEGIKGTDLKKNKIIINKRYPLIEKIFTNLIILLDNLPDYFKSSAFCELIEPNKGIELLKLVKEEFPELSSRVEEMLKKK